jgi:hypothetical protein
LSHPPKETNHQCNVFGTARLRGLQNFGPQAVASASLPARAFIFAFVTKLEGKKALPAK